MMIRHFFMPAMAAAFLCNFLPAAPAFAGLKEPPAETTYETPTTPWVVGPIAAKTDNNTSLCSMKASYPEGRMLVFARDSQGANSIAYDARKDIFDVGRQYGVTLRAGTIKRRLIGLAATRQVLVMQTGIDTVLYTALWNKHKAALEVQNFKYGFDLDVSAADALRALGRCADSFAANTAFAETTLPLGQTAEASLPEQEDVAVMVDEEAPKPARKSARNKKNAAAETVTAEATATPVDTDVENRPAKTRMSKKSRVNKKQADAETELANLRAENKALRSQVEVHNDIREEMAAREAYMPSRPAAAAAVSVAVDTSGLKSLLAAARVASTGDIRTEGNRTLHWTTNNLYGSAQALQMTPGKSLEDMASAHVSQLQSLCKGQFAKKMAPPRRAGANDVVEVDVTCIDGQNDAAAALLFLGSRGKASVITQEGTPDQLDVAMSHREALVSTAANMSGIF